ncbi:MAG TPA: iron-containing redox enzyme family protein [Acidimicrobiales bacterium]|nr:iron-containing redox enzyme family protein [Acidimicrobiales bacterium]
MHTDRIQEVLTDALEGRHLLTHPFYRRWEVGTLGDGELAAYAEQYRHLEYELPVTLSAIAAELPDGPSRQLVKANLADELGVPAPHVALFESFASAAGARSDAAPTKATEALLASVRSAVVNDPVAALAMVAAYEVQAADIAAAKADGLRRHFGMDAAGTQFWDVHRSQEAEHARWSSEALAGLAADPAVVHAAARVAADAWWWFLDEREESAPVGACC